MPTGCSNRDAGTRGGHARLNVCMVAALSKRRSMRRATGFMFSFIVPCGLLGTPAVVSSQTSSDGLVVAGDMVLDRSRLLLPGSNDRHGPLATVLPPIYLPSYWPNGEVPVVFEIGVTPAQRGMFSSACDRWAAVANVRCIPASYYDAEFLTVRVTSRTDCSAVVGFVVPASMWLGPSCWQNLTLVHELGHVLGFLHEHQRPDRDQYVQVQSANVNPSYSGSFAVLFWSHSLTVYDFRSVMHYGRAAFSINGQPTVIPRPGYEAYGGVLGTGSNGGPTVEDGQALRQLYGAPRAPGVPTLVVAEGNRNPVTLLWTAGSSPTPSAYTLLVGTASGVSNLGAFPMGTLTGVTAVAPEGIRLYVRLLALNAVGATASNEVSLLVAPPTPPAAPVLSAPVVTGSTVVLSWSGNAPSYVLLARLDPAGPVIAQLPLAGSSVTVPGVPPGTYVVSIVAVAGGLQSVESNAVVVTVR